MLTVLTSASYDVEILPAFAQHYARLGVESIHISVLELVPGLMRRTNYISTLCPIPVKIYPASKQWVRTKLEAQNKGELRAKVGLTKADWYVPADLDEFIDFEIPIPELINEMLGDNPKDSRSGYGYAKGTFCDRVSHDGLLTAYNPQIPIWKQYSRKTNITRDIMKSNDKKVVLARGHLDVCSGHHHIFDESYKKYPKDFTIDHFAWRQGRLEVLQRRLENYTKLGIKCDSLNRIIDYLTTMHIKVL